MNSDGTGVVRLTDGGYDTYPDWSPDGQRIAYSSRRDGNIYVMNSDGTSQTNLTNFGEHNYYPSWSPDGNRIVFSSTRGGEDGKIYVMNSDGTGVTRLTDGGWDTYPDWSP